MNNKLAILIIAVIFFGCRGSDHHNAPASAVAHGQKYVIDTKGSVVEWKGSMLLESDQESIGYVHIAKGALIVEEGQLAGGTVTIDMKSITYKDTINKNTPVKHLKSPDFFDVEKFPTATIAITRVASGSGKTIKVTGNLTIKGVTRPVTFPAKIEMKDEILKATGKLTIDRTDWGIRYRSGKFYDLVADEIVSDDMEFYMNIVAKK